MKLRVWERPDDKFAPVQLFATLLDCSPPGSSAQGIFQARILGGLPFPSLWDLPDSGTEHASSVSPALAGFFFFCC